MKKSIVLFLISLAFTYAHAINGIDEKFLRLFQESYPGAESVSWEEFKETYAVSFKDAGVDVRILYAKDESYARFTRYYSETNMPYYLKHFILQKFKGKKMAWINEECTVNNQGEIDLAYNLVLEEGQTRWTVKILSNGNVETLLKQKIMN